MRPKLLLNFISQIAMYLLVFLFGISDASHASDLRLGGAFGYGSGGISTTAAVNSVVTPISRSESPGTLSIFLDLLINDFFIVGVEHARAFRFGPTSTGISFSGLLGRWYFLAPAPSVSKSSPDESNFFTKSISPFVGLTAGLALCNITRDSDVVPNVSGSGIFVGYRLGVDYPLIPGLAIRPEFQYSQTPASPSNLSFVSFQVGIYWFL